MQNGQIAHHTMKTKQNKKHKSESEFVPRIELAIFLSSSPVETARAKLIEIGRGVTTEADDDVQCIVGGGVVLSICAMDFFSFRHDADASVMQLSTMLPPLLPLPISSSDLHNDDDDVVGPLKCGCVG